MVVVLPDPFGPRNPCTSPGLTSRSRPSRARVAPNDFTSPRTEITAVMVRRLPRCPSRRVRAPLGPAVCHARSMPVHPRLRPILALQDRLGDDPDATFPAKRLAGTLQARQLGRLVMLPGPKVPTREVMVPVDGGAIRVRLYEPAGRRPRPLDEFLHGGGWCVGDRDQRDPRCRTIAAEADGTVASVDYRLAPETAFPVPVEDCYAALCWLVEHADELGIDPARVSVGGESAGANLAAVLA